MSPCLVVNERRVGIEKEISGWRGATVVGKRGWGRGDGCDRGMRERMVARRVTEAASADASSTAEAAAIPTGEKQKSVQGRANLTSEAS
ncbi:hypothetical protein QJS10_CPB19g01546 [Acorus calamus]|uniref:Uncharacterized protein n=1 Tax=Acorus calamus TaxID=4465 RepID=A0AAV9CG85_ACOCL|nr:hypothetical protein QJS10_CPB19g01546 [Acorus calamus]